MIYISWMISGMALFGATFKSKKWIKMVSTLIGISWFIFANLFNFSTLEFVSYVNWQALIFHTALVGVVILIGVFFAKRKISSAIYGIFAILLWSVLVDTIDYCLLFSSWSAGTNYFVYIWNGILFNLPKCLLPMCLSLLMAVSSISFELFRKKKIAQI